MKNIFNFIAIFLYDIPVFVFEFSELKEKICFGACWFFLATVFWPVSLDMGQFLSILISLSIILLRDVTYLFCLYITTIFLHHAGRNVNQDI